MKYVVEIDTTSKVGEEAIAYLRALKKSSKAVSIREVEGAIRKITAEDLALPMASPPTDEELEAYLNEGDDDEPGTDIEIVRKHLLKKIADRRKNANNKSK